MYTVRFKIKGEPRKTEACYNVLGRYFFSKFDTAEKFKNYKDACFAGLEAFNYRVNMCEELGGDASNLTTKDIIVRKSKVS